MKRKQLACLVSSLAGAQAIAQSPPATAPQDTAMDEVIVTGSRIASPNATSTSPVQVVTREDMQVSGKHDITDIISQLPQNFTNDLGQDLGNRTPGLTTAGGVATADLRGLGPNRTLVLVDGRRLGIGSPYRAARLPRPELRLPHAASHACRPGDLRRHPRRHPAALNSASGS